MIVRPKHIIACGACSLGTKNYMIERGLSKEEVRNFFKNGMLVSEFQERFGSDPRCELVINEALKDGEKEKTNDRL